MFWTQDISNLEFQSSHLPKDKGATGLGGYSWDDVNSMSFCFNQALVSNIPQDHKQSLNFKTHLIPMG
jgi:hypothetical protein